MKNKKLVCSIEVVFCAVIAYVLSLIPLQFGIIDISLGMIPMVILGLRRGFIPALSSGFVWGLMKIVIGSAQILSFSQGFIEYILAFTFAGFTGLFYKQFIKGNHPVRVIILSATVGTFARFFWHFIAGFVFWGQYAPKNFPAVLYSLVVNGGSALITAIVACIFCVLIYKLQPKLFSASK